MKKFLLFAILFILTSPVFATLTGQKSALPSIITTAPSTTLTNYNGITQGVANWSATETDQECVLGASAALEISNMLIAVETAPGGTGQYILTLRKNESDTTLTCTISGANTTCSDLTHVITVNPGDRLTLKSVPSNTPGAPGRISQVYQFQAPTSSTAFFLVSSGTGQTILTNQTSYQQIQMGGMFTTERNEREPMAEAGTLSNLYADVQTAPGAGHSIVCTLRINEADTTVTCTISDTNKTCNDNTHTVAWTVGQRIGWKWVNDSGAAANRPRAGAQYAPTHDGYCIGYAQGASLAGGTQTDKYTWGGAVYSGTEADRQAVFPSCTLRNLYVDMTAAAFTALAAGNNGTVKLRDGGVDTGITCTVTGDGVATQCTDTTHSFAVSSAELISQNMTTVGATIKDFQVSFVLDFGPTPGTGTPYFLLLQGVGYLPNDEVDKKQILV